MTNIVNLDDRRPEEKVAWPIGEVMPLDVGADEFRRAKVEAVFEPVFGESVQVTISTWTREEMVTYSLSEADATSLAHHLLAGVAKLRRNVHEVEVAD